MYEGCVCACDTDLDATVLDEYRIRAVNAERLLRVLVLAARRGKITAELLQTATDVAWKHDN